MTLYKKFEYFSVVFAKLEMLKTEFFILFFIRDFSETSRYDFDIPQFFVCKKIRQP